MSPRAARTFIGDPVSTVAPIHTALVDLFPSSDAVRIVTTNFDRHLSTAVRERHPAADISTPPRSRWGAPFRASWYLHGSIARREPLILSDGDFGQADLSDGWATRFLMEMFVHHTVLFVGYSHQDVVMRYLARSFVGATERFALTPAGRETLWAHLGIIPVHYPERVWVIDTAPYQMPSLHGLPPASADFSNTKRGSKRLSPLLHRSSPMCRLHSKHLRER